MTFLKDKLSGVSAGHLIFGQLEALVFWLVGSIPTVVGFALRFIACRLLFKKLRGFCWIQPGVTLVAVNRLRVGRHFGCNTGTYINAVGTIEIGDYVLIGSNVTISSGRHPIDGAAPPVFARPVKPSPIRIEDDVWIGAGAVIMPGVTLGRGSVIGANAVVTKNTAPYSISVGIPAKVLRYRTDA